LSQAISDYTKAIEINPKNADTYYNRGLIYYKQRNFTQAISDFTKAIEINPKNAGAYNNRGVAYYIEREYRKAWADVHKVEELGYPVTPDFLAELKKQSFLKLKIKDVRSRIPYIIILKKNYKETQFPKEYYIVSGEVSEHEQKIWDSALDYLQKYLLKKKVDNAVELCQDFVLSYDSSSGQKKWTLSADAQRVTARMIIAIDVDDNANLIEVREGFMVD
jgi:tetratricopeptide (TPR) repeat protein